jgi:hypothetical protein
MYDGSQRSRRIRAAALALALAILPLSGRGSFLTETTADTACVAGAGAAANWRVRRTIPIGNEGGEIWVTRVIDTSLATCRDIVFSVADHPPKPPAWYYSTIRHDTAGWDWAMAEPAVSRWGSLQ